MEHKDMYKNGFLDPIKHTDDEKEANIAYCVTVGQVMVTCNCSLCCNWTDSKCSRGYITIGLSGRCESYNVEEEYPSVTLTAATIETEDE